MRSNFLFFLSFWMMLLKCLLKPDEFFPCELDFVKKTCQASFNVERSLRSFFFNKSSSSSCRASLRAKLIAVLRKTWWVFSARFLTYTPMELIWAPIGAPWVLSTWAQLCKKKTWQASLSTERSSMSFFLQIFIIFLLSFSWRQKKLDRFFLTRFERCTPLGAEKSLVGFLSRKFFLFFFSKLFFFSSLIIMCNVHSRKTR